MESVYGPALSRYSSSCSSPGDSLTALEFKDSLTYMESNLLMVLPLEGLLLAVVLLEIHSLHWSLKDSLTYMESVDGPAL